MPVKGWQFWFAVQQHSCDSSLVYIRQNKQKVLLIVGTEGNMAL